MRQLTDRETHFYNFVYVLVKCRFKDRHLKIACHRFFLGKTKDEIAREEGVSREYIRLSLDHSLRRAKHIDFAKELFKEK